MGFRISNIHDYDRFLAIDLGSYRVRAGLYAIQDGEIYLEGYASIRQKERNIIHGMIENMQGVANVIEKSIHEASSFCESIPDDVIISFSPCVSLGDRMTSQYLRRDPTAPITMDELDQMIERIEKTSLARAKEKSKKEYAIIHDDIRLISSSITSIEIDGISIDDPLGVKGEHVRITVMNIYTVASEYNILRSVVSSLKKNIISLVPSPLLFPKLLDHSQYSRESNFMINLGYTHVTIISVRESELQYFETFSRGTKMLLEMLGDAFPGRSYTEIESLLMRESPSEDDRSKREAVTREYFHYIIDMIASVLVREEDTLRQRNVILSGGIMNSDWCKNLFFEVLTDQLAPPSHILKLVDIIEEMPLPSEYLRTESLSMLAYELLHIKKDPLIRILRYTLYHYE